MRHKKTESYKSTKIRCCSCDKYYDFQLHEIHKALVTICPWCGSVHAVHFEGQVVVPIDEAKYVPEIRLGTYYVNSHVSRIQRDSDGVDMSGSDDNPVTGWSTSNQFILVVGSRCSNSTKDPVDPSWKLQYQKDGGGYGDVGSTGEIKWATSSSQVSTDDEAWATGNHICTLGGNQRVAGQSNLGDNLLPDSGTQTVGAGDQIENRFCLDPAGASASSVYQFQIVDVTNTGDYPLSATLTIAAGATTYTVSHDLDAYLQKAMPVKTTDLDAILILLGEKTLSIDALLNGVGIERTTALNALLNLIDNTETLDLDAILTKAITDKVTDIDAYLQGEMDSLQADLDALLRKLIADKTVDLDSLLNATGLEATADLDAILEFVITKVTDLDALLNKVGIERTADIDAILYNIVTKQAEIDALLTLVDNEVATDLDAILLFVPQKVLDIDALLNASGLEVSTVLDAVLYYTDTKETDIDSLLTKVDNVWTVSINALLNKAGITATLDLDALVNEAGLTKELDLDAILIAAAEGEISTTIDALLNEVGVTFQVDLDAILYLAKTVDTDLDAVLVGSTLKSLSVDALLQGGLSGDTSLDAYLTEMDITKTTTLDSYLSKIQEATTALDAVIASQPGLSIDLDGLLTGEETQTVTLDAWLFVGYTKETTIDSILFKTLASTVNFDACVRGEVEQVTFLDALIYSTLVIQVPRFVLFSTLQQPTGISRIIPPYCISRL